VSEVLTVSKRVAYGGQAVIEGVMMRGPHTFAVACRTPEGEIVVQEEPVPAFFTRYTWAKWPFVRGTFALLDSLVLGMKSLLYSATVANEGQGGAGTGLTVERTGKGGAGECVGAPPGRLPVTGLAISGSAFVGMALGLVVFVLLPSYAADWVRPLIKKVILSGGWRDFATNLTEGLIRVILFLGYIRLISRMDYVQRLFQYHGAEHKVINAFENEGVLDADVAMRQSTIHPRCGTNFVLTVLLVKVLLASFFGWPSLGVRIALRLLALPVVAGVAYEVIRLAGKYRHVTWLQVLVAPGLWTQRLTTREPSRDMVEVAVRALDTVVRREAEVVPARTVVRPLPETPLAEPAPL
jgi:uncharacterized protein YqhQ